MDNYNSGDGNQDRIDLPGADHLDMQPITAPPALQTAFGIGTTIYGERDYDPPTHSYVRTMWFVLLLIPILALRAYRVVDAGPYGLVFIGRVPLSRLARAWNVCVLLGISAILGGFLYMRHYNDAATVAQRRLDEAGSSAEAGKLKSAADTYQDILNTAPKLGTQALAGLDALLDRAGDNEEVAGAFVTAAAVAKVHQAPLRVFERGLDRAEKMAATHPAAAGRILEAIAPLGARDEARFVELRQGLLEKVVAAEPDNLDALSSLAEVCELRRDFERCLKLLAPHAKKLGEREGARVLGQILVGQGKFEEAYPLLETYSEPRVKQFKEAEQHFQNALKAEDDAVFKELQTGKVADFNYSQYQRSARDVQDRMLAEYLNKRHKDNPRLKEALSRLRDVQRIVPVVLDLGIVLLRRGQALPEPQARRAELEKAEKTFLSVAGVVGQAEEFRLNLGQVYYWLGKEKEGRALFDEALKASAQRSQTSSQVAMMLREVGAISEARQLLEKSHASEIDAGKKKLLAGHRALLFLDLNDKIAWLDKADSENPETRADLCSARGMKAEMEGRDEEAAQQYRECIKVYEGIPIGAVSLNNGALAYTNLYHVTGDPKLWTKSNALLEKALEMKPRDALILQNLAGARLNAGVGAVVAADIDLSLLRKTGSLSLLSFLSKDKAGRLAWGDKVRKNLEVDKALAMYDKLQVLTPKSPGVYASLASIYVSLNDVKGVTAAVERMQQAELDLADLERRAREDFQGKHDAQRRGELRGSLPRQEARLKSARTLGGATLAVAIDDVIRARENLAALGDPYDAPAVLSLAREAHQARPSTATERLVVAALLGNVHDQLEKADAAYKALTGKHVRHVGHSYLLAIVLFRDGPTAQKAKDMAELKEALDLIKDLAERGPEDVSTWHWAILHNAYPKTAAKIADGLPKNEIARQLRTLSDKVGRLQVGQVCQSFWERLMAGKTREANEFLEQAVDQGVPLPLAEMKVK